MVSRTPSDVGLKSPPPPLQLASRCRDAGIHLLLAQCNGETCRLEGSGDGSDRALGGEGRGHGVDAGPEA